MPNPKLEGTVSFTALVSEAHLDELKRRAKASGRTVSAELRQHLKNTL